MAPKTEEIVKITIKPENIRALSFNIVGTAPYVQHKFSKKARDTMLGAQTSQDAGAKKKKKSARDIKEDYDGATHFSTEGWCGIPASAFRTAMVDVCRTADFKMTIAKMSVFVYADGYDADEGVPLVRIHGTREMHQAAVRFHGTCSVAIRPMWREWKATVRVEFDGDQFTDSDVFNLLARAGRSVGVGEGRPYSKDSTGCGWGTFKIA